MFQCDIFIIEDNVQFERQGFQNRNRLKTSDGVRWLTVPIEHVGKSMPISEITIANAAEPHWAERHWLTFRHNYAGAPFWEKFEGFFEQTYSQQWIRLMDLNMYLIRGLMKFLKIEKPLVMASSLKASGKKSDLVLAQCKALGATVHLAGIGARDYLDLESFKKEGIKVVFQEFEHPVYQQLYGPFVPNLSVVDYLFCTGGKEWRNLGKKLQETGQ